MLQAMLAGVASIKAQQTKMNVIGNNLANVNTTAYKGTRVNFQELLSQVVRGATGPTDSLGGQNPMQYGLGVVVSGLDTNVDQGSLNATNRISDLALQGQGYFVVSNGQGLSYTRDGAFDIDANGDFVMRASGQRVIGWPADALGNVDTSAPIDVNSKMNIPLGQLSAVQQTSLVEMAGNLKSTADPAEDWTTTVRVYDATGGAHDIAIEFSNHQVPAAGTAPTGATSSWEWSASENGTSVGAFGGTGNQRLYFDGNGKMLNGDTLQGVTVSASGSANSFDVDLDFSSISQLATDTQVTTRGQNGYPAGSLSNYVIGSDGVITGIFTNGLTRPLGQLAIAGFPNPGGLERSGSNLWEASDNAGIAIIGEATKGGRGIVTSGFLEQSNVDIGQEFTDLIITQRGFQANTRIVTTVDEMMQDLINIKR